MGSKTLANKDKRENTCNVCNLKFQTIQALRSHQIAKHPGEESCDLCSLKFSSVQTLRSHQTAKHPAEYPKKELKESSPASRLKATPITPAMITSRVSKRIQLRKGGDVDTKENENSEQNMGEGTNKIDFVCPKCDKVFRMYFQALKHIQNKHCVDEEGKPVPPDSSDLIKPIRLETCSKCKKRVPSTHKCTANVPVNTYCCLGCDEELLSVSSFNKHVMHIHYDNVDSLFFKTNEEFSLWKQNTETQVRIKYLAMNKAFSQTYYQCNYVSTKNEFNKTYLCSSLIITKELSSGIQVHYIKQHYGHTCPEYELPQEFSHYLTNKKKNDSVFDNLIEKKDEDEDLFVKFKNLMKNITNDAEKLSIPHLKTLLRSALKMQALLNSYDEEHDDKEEQPLIGNNMTDDQITDALEGKRSSARLKRKSDTRGSVDAKRNKVDKSERVSDDKKSDTRGSVDAKRNKVDKSERVSDDKKSDTRGSVDAKRNKVDKSERVSDDNLNSKSKNDENGNKTSKENKAFEPRPRSSPGILSPTFADTYKQFISSTEPSDDSTKKVMQNTKRKEIVKTKMGQFSPKKKATNTEETVEKIKSKTNILKPSKTNSRLNCGIDLKYEIREQENDCNILVFKI